MACWFSKQLSKNKPPVSVLGEGAENCPSFLTANQPGGSNDCFRPTAWLCWSAERVTPVVESHSGRVICKQHPPLKKVNQPPEVDKVWFFQTVLQMRKTFNTVACCQFWPSSCCWSAVVGGRHWLRVIKAAVCASFAWMQVRPREWWSD